MREALSKLIANMVHLGATEKEILEVINMSKQLIDYEKRYGELNPFLEKEQITTAHN